MTFKRIRNLLIAVLVLVAVIYAGISYWSNQNLSVDETESDPAVIVANEIGEAGEKYTEGFVGPPGNRIHYVSAGEGEPIIFMHGFPSYWFTMFPLMEEFKSDYQVIAIDGLGTGRSDAPNSVDAYKIEKLINSIEQVVTELNLGEVHLVGHDWGAVITAGYVQAYPSKVKTLTAMSALPHNVILARVEHDVDHQELFSYTSQFARATPFLIYALGIKNQIWQDTYQPFLEEGVISPDYAARLKQDIGNPRRLNRFIHWYRANLTDFDQINDDHYWPSKSARISVPTLFIYGSDDQVVTDPLIEDMKKLSDDLDVIEFDGVGHRPHFEQLSRVSNEIRRFLSEN